MAKTYQLVFDGQKALRRLGQCLPLRFNYRGSLRTGPFRAVGLFKITLSEDAKQSFLTGTPLSRLIRSGRIEVAPESTALYKLRSA